MRPTLVQGGACLLALLATVIATPAEARGACNRFEGYLSSYSRELEAGDRDRLVFIDRRESRTAGSAESSESVLDRAHTPILLSFAVSKSVVDRKYSRSGA